jgi:hypothetical protein
MMLLGGLFILVLQVYALVSFNINFKKLVEQTRKLTGRNFGIAFKTMSVTKAVLRRQRSLMCRAYKTLIFSDLNDDIPALRLLKLKTKNRVLMSIILFIGCSIFGLMMVLYS